MQQLISKALIVCGVIIYLLNRLRSNVSLDIINGKCEFFKKEAKQRAFRLNLISLSI